MMTKNSSARFTVLTPTLNLQPLMSLRLPTTPKQAPQVVCRFADHTRPRERTHRPGGAALLFPVARLRLRCLRSDPRPWPDRQPQHRENTTPKETEIRRAP